MEQLILKAYDLREEIDLNRLAQGLGITRKFRWEEPMVLSATELSSLAAAGMEIRAYVFSFGGVVFVNCPEIAMKAFFHEMTRYSELFCGYPGLRCTEDYKLRIEPEATPTVTNDTAVLPSLDHGFVDIIAFVLAQSVSLERIENEVDQAMDGSEALIALLNRGKLGIPDRKLSRLAATILDFRYKSVANIMVLEKPDITWENEDADRFHAKLATLFELNQRYVGIRHKYEILLETARVFSDLSHARRAARLEWIIIILIAIEIVLYVAEVLHKAG